MTNTPYELVRRALVKLQVKAPGQALTAAEAVDGMREANQMLGSWRNDGHKIFLVERHEFPLVLGQSIYTIGPGGDFDTARPLRIRRWGYLDTASGVGTFEHEGGDPLTLQRWAQIRHRSRTGRSIDEIYYEPENPLGKIHVIPEPAISTLKLVLYLETTLGQFTGLHTQYDFPDGYEDALLYNLAIRLAPEYEREPQPIIVSLARESLANIERTNQPTEELELDPALPGMGGNRGYDIYSDDWKS